MVFGGVYRCVFLVVWLWVCADKISVNTCSYNQYMDRLVASVPADYGLMVQDYNGSGTSRQNLVCALCSSYIIASQHNNALIPCSECRQQQLNNTEMLLKCLVRKTMTDNLNTTCKKCCITSKRTWVRLSDVRPDILNRLNESNWMEKIPDTTTPSTCNINTTYAPCTCTSNTTHAPCTFTSNTTHAPCTFTSNTTHVLAVITGISLLLNVGLLYLRSRQNQNSANYPEEGGSQD
ncbi:uncharacterized protein LOC114794043 isoform X3 [Denticeps clupeoides]|uniref:uncharacterized protein LOC114794043 isoform X2 n=1 Tax=Denticeps clupeoides TaxID=299321 RepID=UPI0010A32098|nr:uncharacterized protein LOC114794043 isoform X2 [Denticeps clupeoides]XP_028842150.1 uncharacterized protein LOC114794043 isoform X3 [Denticeps clupeoides]